MWDRKTEGGFPELKVLVSSDQHSSQTDVHQASQKQRIRDVIQPGKSLGHSDHKQDCKTGEDCVKPEAAAQT